MPAVGIGLGATFLGGRIGISLGAGGVPANALKNRAGSIALTNKSGSLILSRKAA